MLSFGNISIDLDSKLCYVDNNRVSATKAEFLLLRFFIENPEKIFSPEELNKAIYGGKSTGGSILCLISKVRKVIKPSNVGIINHSGFGYGLFIKENKSK